MTVVSAVVAWYTLSSGDEQVRELASTLLPAVSSAEVLAAEAQRFTHLTEQLSRVTAEAQRVRLQTQQKQHLAGVFKSLNTLIKLGFKTGHVRQLHSQAISLADNMEIQHRLAQSFLNAKIQLAGSIAELEEKQAAFLKAAQPRISEGYKRFLEQGNELGNRLRSALAKHALKGGGIDHRDLDEDLRISLGTLINIEAGEMRASLEMLATVNLIAGIYREAAIVGDIGRVKKLQRQFEEQRGNLNRLRLILSTSRPAIRMVLIKAKPVMDMGRGPNNIFELRLAELSTRDSAKDVALQNHILAQQLGNSVDQLVRQAQNASLKASARLSREWSNARLLQTGAAVMAVVLVIAVGFFYVGRNIINRITKLSHAMEEHARGNEAPIPKGADDELGDMAQALRAFVEQRNKAEAALKQSAGRFRKLAEVSPYPVLIGEASGELTYISPKFSEIFGYTAKDLPDRQALVNHLFPEPGQSHLFKGQPGSQNMAEGAATVRSELPLICKDGSIKETIIHSVEMPGGGFYLIAQDVTEMRLAQARLLTQEKLASAIETAGAVCHELNQPLQVVMSRAEILMFQYQQDESLRRHLETFTKEFERMNKLTRRLQNLTHYRTKDYVADVKILDLDRAATKPE
jgi:PAS domain S-box-containing protein